MPISPDQLDDLARRAAGGDTEAMDLLLVEVRPRVLAHCRRLLPFVDDADDACQETLIRLTQHIGGFEGRARFSTWVYQVTVNTSRDTYRRLRRAAESSTDQAPERPDPHTTSVIAGSRLDLLDALEQLEAAHPALVEPFVLRDVYDLPYADIAAQVGAPLGTVKRRIHDAREWMRDFLERI